MRLEEPESVLLTRAASAAGIDPERVRGLRIVRRSVDARRRGKGRRLRFIVHADLVVDSTYRGVKFDAAVHAGTIVEAPAVGSFRVAEPTVDRRQSRVVVVGAGPAGLYAALVLATNGRRGRPHRPRRRVDTAEQRRRSLPPHPRAQR